MLHAVVPPAASYPENLDLCFKKRYTNFNNDETESESLNDLPITTESRGGRHKI